MTDHPRDHIADHPRYHINVFWYPDERCWIADVPDLRPCSARGENAAQAVASVDAKIDEWLTAARLADLPVPEPCYCPALFAGR